VHESEALLDHLIEHRNTAPFVACVDLGLTGIDIQ